ncbi:MAG: AraC family transcriptional regulator [Desulfovibrio sp.]|uniref:AraC family transcriptional regulator n=1 Tax=Desulfovibrio sp. TaxID=885 RepID=UPI00135D733B|nr:helix-turn-helix transcriptional regulator [Desulfovibrio sp.]MTJ93099.1 AraC family transcriptional regulator [Desulfovibrio sp.]
MPSRLPATQQTFTSPDKYPYLEVRTTLQSTLPYAEHFHSAFSFGLILEGGTCFTLMGQPHKALKGDIALIAPGMAHSCNPLDGKARSYHMAYLDAAWFVQHICNPLGIAEMYAVTQPVVRDPTLFQQGLAALEAFCRGEDGAESLFVDMFTRLQATYGCLVSITATDRRTDLPVAAANLLLTAHDATTGEASLSCPNNAPDHAPVASLARRAGLRRESFSRAFRRTAGLPPNAWLHCLRLEKARVMLRQGKSITEAALAAGYADQSHFHRMFVKFYSVTPGCYQRSRSHSYNTRK